MNLASPPSRGRGPYGQRMGLGVEHVLIQTELLVVIREQEEEILQRLAQEEAFHLISGCGVQWVTDVTDGGVAPTKDLGKKWSKEVKFVYLLLAQLAHCSMGIEILPDKLKTLHAFFLFCSFRLIIRDR